MTPQGRMMNGKTYTVDSCGCTMMFLRNSNAQMADTAVDEGAGIGHSVR